jgi:valyl-tRNA synthetase
MQPVGRCYRASTKPQWWMRMEPLAKPAIDVVESGELIIRPELQQ